MDVPLGACKCFCFFLFPLQLSLNYPFYTCTLRALFEGHVDLDHVKEIKVEERASGGLGIFIN